MTKTERNKFNKFNNQGSALVVVVIVIAFICILATLLLYLSVMNYQMKSTDYKTRVSFYGSEIPLEELRVQLAVDWSKAGEEAYKSVMSQYTTLSTTELRMAEYQKVMSEEFIAIWDERNMDPTGGPTSSWIYGITAALGNNSDYHVINGSGTTTKCADADCSCPYHIIIVDLADLGAGVTGRIETHTGTSENFVVIRGIRVSYMENNFFSVIQTDLRMDVPVAKDASDNPIWGINPIVYDETTGAKMNYENTWGTDSTVSRADVDYKDFVNYLNWTKR